MGVEGSVTGNGDSFDLIRRLSPIEEFRLVRDKEWKENGSPYVGVDANVKRAFEEFTGDDNNQGKSGYLIFRVVGDEGLHPSVCFVSDIDDDGEKRDLMEVVHDIKKRAYPEATRSAMIDLAAILDVGKTFDEQFPAPASVAYLGGYVEYPIISVKDEILLSYSFGDFYSDLNDRPLTFKDFRVGVDMMDLDTAIEKAQSAVEGGKPPALTKDDGPA